MSYRLIVPSTSKGMVGAPSHRPRVDSPFFGLSSLVLRNLGRDDPRPWGYSVRNSHVLDRPPSLRAW